MQPIEIPHRDDTTLERLAERIAASHHTHSLDSAAVRTLWRYYSGRFLGAFLASLVILALLVLVVDMLLNLGDVLENQKSLADALRVLVFRCAAQYLAYLVPVATFAGAFFSVGRAARNHEVLAVRAGGISPLRAFAPLLWIALLLAAGSLWLNEAVGVAAARSLNRLTDGPSDRLVLRSGVIWHHSGRVIYRGKREDPARERLADVSVFERDASGRLVRTVHAASAERISATQWRFQRASVRRFTPGDASAPPRLERFDDVELQLATGIDLRPDVRELDAVPLPVLREYVAAIEDSGSDPGAARSVLHARLSMPTLAFVFAVFAIPLALGVERTRTLARPALYGIGFLMAFILAREYSMGIALRADESSPLVSWGVVLVFTSIGAVQLARVRR